MQKSGLRKSKLYARYGKEIFMTARAGGTNIESNLALKHLIERAKKEEVPVDIIERNIKKAEGNDEIDYQANRYEGFGPGGSNFLIDTLTDNVNRTVSEVRFCFTKIDSKLGLKGSVEHMYDHLSKLEVKITSEEELLEILFGAGIEVEDIEEDGDTHLIIAAGYELDRIESVLRDSGVEIVFSKSGWFPQTTVTLKGDDREKFNQFMSLINDVDDVQAVYHNVATDIHEDKED